MEIIACLLICLKVLCSDVVMETRLLLMFVLLGGSFGLADRIFAWLVLVGIMRIFALLEYLYGWPETCSYDLHVLSYF